MSTQTPAAEIAALSESFDVALAQLTTARQSDPRAPIADVLESARALMAVPGGLDALYARVPAIESAAVFANSDWAQPAILQPALAERSLRQGEANITLIEALSEIRLLAVAMGDYFHPGVSAERARNFLTQVMALNLDLLSGQMNEADRERPDTLGEIVLTLYRYLLDRLGYESILDSLVDEIQRLLVQRPIQTDSIKRMIGQIARCLFDPSIDTVGMDKAARLVRGLFGPSPGCREDPGIEVYAERLLALDEDGLTAEASSFASVMHETGLVSPYHPVLLRYLRGQHDRLIPVALGLSMTGRDSLECYRQLVHALIDEAVFSETSQAVYGLTMLLERGSLFSPPMAAGLWRQIKLPLCAQAANTLSAVFSSAQPPRVFLLAGVLSLIGQPLGVGQGNNPTCQSVIGISMWAHNDADYLLQLVTWAARDDEIIMRFEGQQISSKGLEAGLAKQAPMDVDPVSLILVPHLDRIYAEMGRLCGTRDDDLHRWINPEMYGWWVGHGFRVVANHQTGAIEGHEDFLRDFYARYHPYYNGHLPVIHPQPAGIAVTDNTARLVGRHAITITRVALDHDGEIRVYFFNPNNDSRQDWGQGIHCAIHGHGERHGEASLPIVEFASRLFVFHFDPLELGDRDAAPDAEVTQAVELARHSWAPKA